VWQEETSNQKLPVAAGKKSTLPQLTFSTPTPCFQDLRSSEYTSIINASATDTPGSVLVFDDTLGARDNHRSDGNAFLHVSSIPSSAAF
jgi:hypothetical protein